MTELQIYSTCPQSKDVAPGEYLDAVAATARWSEAAGCTGMLVYTDNGIVDPWLVSQAAIAATERLAPLVAVQPVYMHPYAAATMVSSLAYLHGRAVHLNMLAGGFKNDLVALGDETPHDDRYLRTVEYTRILTDLLRGEVVTLDGRYYRVENLRLAPPLPAELRGEVLVSGSSPAGRAAAAELGATPVRYPEPVGAETLEITPGSGVRVGIVARDSSDEAWRVATERFPDDRRGQVAHSMAMSVSDSAWHHQLSATARSRPVAPAGRVQAAAEPDPYWLGPFQNYRTFCPYLVGSHDRVAQVVAHYMDQGTRLFVLDIPPDATELEHAGVVFERAKELALA